jgi:hypothetical protein
MLRGVGWQLFTDDLEQHVKFIIKDQAVQVESS